MVDDQPLWGNNRVVAPTLGDAIVVVDLGDKFTVKESSNDSKLMENMEALTTKIVSQFKKIKGEMKEIRDECNSCGGFHPSSECDNKPMGGPRMKKPTMPMEGTDEGDIEETTTAYKPKISYPQLLHKEKMEERYSKFIDLIKEVKIYVPLIDVLAGMPNYKKFLKDLMSNKNKMEQISHAFLNEECSVIVQNKLLPKLGDLGSFLILCTIACLVEYLTLADLGASINLMPYSLYASLLENTLKPIRMSIRLANHT
nr:reverse transcriptase domain-containing protein [Tanacetum cinerariifolium]